MAAATRFPWDDRGDRVTFETPEQTRIDVHLAPFGSRLAAALLDRLVILLASLGLLALGFLVATGVGGAVDGDLAGVILAGLVGFYFLFTVFYYVWGEVLRDGQTLGKRVMGIRTILATGQGVTLGASVVRNLARVVDEIPLLWLVPALTRSKQRLGDVLAGTLVVQAERGGDAAPLDAWRLAPTYAELTDRRFFFTGDIERRVFPDDLNLLEHLAARVAQLPATSGARS